MGLSKLHSTCPWEHLEQKYFLNKIFNFFNHSRTLSKRTFGLLSESFRRGCHNCILHVLRTNWRKNEILQNFQIFLSFLDIELFFLALCRKIFVGVLKTAYYVSIKTFCGEKLFGKLLVFSVILGHWAKHFPAFCRKVFVGVVTTASYMSSGTFGGRINSCLTFSFCYRFRTLKESFSTFCRKVLDGFVKTAFYVSMGTFRGKIFFK